MNLPIFLDGIAGAGSTVTRVYTWNSPIQISRRAIFDGRRYLWRDLVALRQAQAQPRAEQPTLFELHEDHRPPGERNATERYCEPSLFTEHERSR
jgi:hypothetical protein